MNQLTLEWVEADRPQTQIITDQQPSKNPGTVRIGRDPMRCDLVLQHPTVSGLHVEIFFDPQQHQFLIRNLRDSNPPVVGQQRLTQGVAPLQPGINIYLGQVALTVKAIATSVPQTVLVSPSVATPTPEPAASSAAPEATPDVTPKAASDTAPTPAHAYGLLCPKCHQVSPYEQLQAGCPWCGMSLAAAASILMVPEAKAVGN